MIRLTFAAVVVAAVASTAGCTAQNFCAKRTQCLDEERDINLEDDSTNVCAAEFDGEIARLRANEEEDCQRLADALLAVAACQAGLKCDDFVEPDLGGECDDQLDDLEDARDDVSGNECSAQD